MVGRRK